MATPAAPAPYDPFFGQLSVPAPVPPTPAVQQAPPKQSADAILSLYNTGPSHQGGGMAAMGMMGPPQGMMGGHPHSMMPPQQGMMGHPQGMMGGGPQGMMGHPSGAPQGMPMYPGAMSHQQPPYGFQQAPSQAHAPSYPLPMPSAAGGMAPPMGMQSPQMVAGMNMNMNMGGAPSQGAYGQPLRPMPGGPLGQPTGTFQGYGMANPQTYAMPGGFPGSLGQR